MQSMLKKGRYLYNLSMHVPLQHLNNPHWLFFRVYAGIMKFTRMQQSRKNGNFMYSFDSSQVKFWMKVYKYGAHFLKSQKSYKKTIRAKNSGFFINFYWHCCFQIGNGVEKKTTPFLTIRDRVFRYFQKSLKLQKDNEKCADTIL